MKLMLGNNLKKTTRRMRMPVGRFGSYAFACILALSVWPEITGYSENVAPTLVVDLNGNDNGGDRDNVQVMISSTGTITFNAVGGSTDEPDSTQGHPPWTKTGNVQYTWNIKKAGTCEDLHISVDDGDTTTEPLLTIFLDQAGSNSITVQYQEEYRDSSNPPVTIYWPQ